MISLGSSARVAKNRKGRHRTATLGFHRVLRVTLANIAFLRDIFSLLVVSNK